MTAASRREPTADEVELIGSAEWVKARESFFGAVLINGESRDIDIHAGQVVRSTNPAVKGREHMFEALDDPATSGAPRRRGRPASDPNAPSGS